jgi:hypothetical protein
MPMSIESREAAAALSDIEDIVRRVRQSRIYHLASLMLIMWGALVFAGNVGSLLWPRMAGYIWIAVNVVGFAGSIAISTFGRAETGIRRLDGRALAALLLFFAFGTFACWLGHFGPRELGAFWPIYFMLMYTIAGLWLGKAFVGIGLSITALTLIGYFFVGPWFEHWMAVVNGGGLMLGGFWMRRS